MFQYLKLSAFMLFFLFSHYAWGSYQSEDKTRINDLKKQMKEAFKDCMNAEDDKVITQLVQCMEAQEDTFFIVQGNFIKGYDQRKQSMEKRDYFFRNMCIFIQLIKHNGEKCSHMRYINKAYIEYLQLVYEESRLVQDFFSVMLPLFDAFGQNKEDIFSSIKSFSKNKKIDQEIRGTVIDYLHEHVFLPASIQFFHFSYKNPEFGVKKIIDMYDFFRGYYDENRKCISISENISKNLKFYLFDSEKLYYAGRMKNCFKADKQAIINFKNKFAQLKEFGLQLVDVTELQSVLQDNNCSIADKKFYNLFLGNLKRLRRVYLERSNVWLGENYLCNILCLTVFEGPISIEQCRSLCERAMQGTTYKFFLKVSNKEVTTELIRTHKSIYIYFIPVCCMIAWLMFRYKVPYFTNKNGCGKLHNQ